jgi:hypothetical protein
MASSYPFFTASRGALEGVTKLFDFVWPAAAGLWNLRWQVAGFHNALGKTSVPELRARFTAGSGIDGANLHRACLEHTWEQQKRDLALVVLVNLFAVYESWASTLVAEIQPILPAGLNPEKALQFPPSVNGQQVPRGVFVAMFHLLGTTSVALDSELTPQLRRQANVHGSHLDAMLTVYRFFKECRNSLMHQGGFATQTAIDAAKDVAKLDPKKLPFPIPRHAPPVLGMPVELDLHGIVGLSCACQPPTSQERRTRSASCEV